MADKKTMVVNEASAEYSLSSMDLCPRGYKQTEVGEIPEDWVKLEIGEFIDLVTGFPFPSSKYTDSGIKLLRGSNIKRGVTDWDDKLVKYWPEITFDLQKYELKSGDIVIAMDGSLVGRSFAQLSCLDLPALLLQRVARIRVQETIDQSYLKAWVCSKLFTEHCDSVKTVTAIPHISPEDIRTFSIKLPKDIEEQKSIAKALSDVDELIVSLEKLIAKKRDIKTATMQQLLTGKKRLPGFGQGKGYKQTELGEIPEDWDVRNIGSFTDCTAGGTPSTTVTAYWGGDNPWMSSGELHLKRVKDVEARITDQGLKNSSTKYVPRHCVLMGLAGQGKTRGTVAVNEIELCTNQSIAAIFPSDNHDTYFLFYNLDTRYEELRGMSTGDGGRGGLNLTIIKKIPIAMPSIVEQISIVSVLFDIDKEIEYLEQRFSKIKAIKQGMMQELLTGRTRLVDVSEPFRKAISI